MRVRSPQRAGGLCEATTPHPRADRAQAPRGRSAAGRGKEVPEVAKHLEVSEATYHRWRAQYGGLKADDVRRLKELEVENARLKRIVADKELQIEALKELGRGNW
jgi:putative transposase